MAKSDKTPALTLAQWKLQVEAAYPGKEITYIPAAASAYVGAYIFVTQVNSTTETELITGEWTSTTTHHIYPPEVGDEHLISTEEAVNLATSIHEAADIRESSYNKRAANKARLAAESAKQSPYVDWNKFYKVSLRDACAQANPALAEPVFLLLHYAWNDALAWAERVMNIDKSIAIPHKEFLARQAVLEEKAALRDEARGRREMDAADVNAEVKAARGEAL